MPSMFLLQHSYARREEDEDEVKVIGIYSSRREAETTIERYRGLPGFREYPDCFYIDEYEIDRNYWEEGFIVV